MAGEATKTQGSVLDLFRVPMLAQRTCVMVVVKYGVLGTFSEAELGHEGGVQETQHLHVFQQHPRDWSPSRLD